MVNTMEGENCKNTGCQIDLIGNGVCNENCNNEYCDFDGNDCSKVDDGEYENSYPPDN
jgi:hypothetical protein